MCSVVHIDRWESVTCSLNSPCYNFICIFVYFVFAFALANPVQMFNHPPPPVAHCEHLVMAFCNRAKELGARGCFIMPSPTVSRGTHALLVIKLNSCPLQHLVQLHACFLCLLDTKNSCSFLFVVTSSMSCAAIMSVYLSLRQNVQYVEYYGRFLRQTTLGCTFVKRIAMTKMKTPGWAILPSPSTWAVPRCPLHLHPYLHQHLHHYHWMAEQFG